MPTVSTGKQNILNSHSSWLTEHTGKAKKNLRSQIQAVKRVILVAATGITTICIRSILESTSRSSNLCSTFQCQQVFHSMYYFPVPAGLPIYVLLSSASRSSNLYTTFQYLQAFLAGEIAKVNVAQSRVILHSCVLS